MNRRLYPLSDAQVLLCRIHADCLAREESCGEQRGANMNIVIDERSYEQQSWAGRSPCFWTPRRG